MDAQAVLSGLVGRVAFKGQSNIPRQGPLLVVLNHYTRPGLAVNWAALAISACMPAAPIWVMTSAWTKRQPGWDALRTRLTGLLFKRLARVYGFITMPPMPPVEEEVIERSASVRRLMDALRKEPQTILCMAPEGRDFPDGQLGEPPPGIGRLVLQACKTLQRVLPVGVYEGEGQLVVSFGKPCSLREILPLQPTDREVSALLMRLIAAQLPQSLDGAYSSQTGER